MSIISQSNIDSLFRVWSNSNNNAQNRLNAAQQLILKKYRKSNLDSCYSIAKQQYSLAKKVNNVKHQIEALRTIAIVYSFLSMYDICTG